VSCLGVLSLSRLVAVAVVHGSPPQQLSTARRLANSLAAGVGERKEKARVGTPDSLCACVSPRLSVCVVACAHMFWLQR
jgi:hypothetical protein